MYMSVLPTFWTCTTCMKGLWRLEGGVGAPWNCVTASCELLCACWEPNLDPVQEQSVLLILSHLSSPHFYLVVVAAVAAAAAAVVCVHVCPHMVEYMQVRG